MRRLPSEILAEIFALCWMSFTPSFEEVDSVTSSIDTEMARLAHLPLLVVSQVCARWHGIVMGTPSLWTTIEIDSVVCTPTGIDRTTKLLESVLERSQKCVLTVAFTMDDVTPHGPVLELLAAHSERWHTATFICGTADLQHLSSVKGRLPRLETLRLWGSPSPLDAFVDAPRLTELEFGGTPDSLLMLGKLPLHQLHRFQCGEFLGLAELMGLGVSPTMDLMPRLSNRTEFKFEVRLCEGVDAFDESITVPSITSDISALSIDVADGFSPSNVGLTITKIVDGLTLPSLNELGMESKEYPLLILPWPHRQFLALSDRSSFPSHLRALQLYHVIITEAELLECLYSLPCLEWFTIADHQTTANGGVDQHLITDTLFTQLTSGPDNPCPVPRLRFLGCVSLLQFDDHVYLDFLSSRLDLPDPGPFESHLYWLPGHRRELESDVAVRIAELRVERKLTFSFVDAES